jgi:hypothetical protein
MTPKQLQKEIERRADDFASKLYVDLADPEKSSKGIHDPIAYEDSRMGRYGFKAGVQAAIDLMQKHEKELGTLKELCCRRIPWVDGGPKCPLKARAEKLGVDDEA